MALVPLRVLLDHAAENDYGVAAFNVNNMEQIQAIMEAAQETDSPVIVQASRGARTYSQDAYLRHLMLAAVELYPHIPDHDAPGPRQQRGDLQERHRKRLHVRHDGRLVGRRRQDAGLFRLQRPRDERSRETGPRAKRLRRRRTRLPRVARDRQGRRRKMATAPKASCRASNC